ncbi:MAG: response regulator [Bacteroidota bacterium]
MGKQRRILVVDDERDIIDLLRYNLEREGFAVDTATDGQEALDKVAKKPDLVILDVMMPEIDGFEVCREIRANSSTRTIPIIILTAKSAEVDEIVGLELGADDYIMKPTSPRKLLARVKAILRRSEVTEKESSAGAVTIDGVLIDPVRYRVEIDAMPVSFARKEFELLNFLAHHPGRVFTRQMLLDAVWGSDSYVVDRTVDVHVRRVREKLGQYAYLIETIKGVGYRFRE